MKTIASGMRFFARTFVIYMAWVLIDRTAARDAQRVANGEPSRWPDTNQHHDHVHYDNGHTHGDLYS